MKRIITFIYLGELKCLSEYIKQNDFDKIRRVLSTFEKSKLFFEILPDPIKKVALKQAFIHSKTFNQYLWVYVHANCGLKNNAYLKARDLVFGPKKCKIFFDTTKTVDISLLDRCLHNSAKFKHFEWISDRASGELKNTAVMRAGMLMNNQRQYKWVYENSEGELKARALLLASSSLENYDDCFWVYHGAKILEVVAAKFNAIDKIKELMVSEKKPTHSLSY